MQFCNQCGARVEGSEYCPQCGAYVATEQPTTAARVDSPASQYGSYDDPQGFYGGSPPPSGRSGVMIVAVVALAVALVALGGAAFWVFGGSSTKSASGASSSTQSGAVSDGSQQSGASMPVVASQPAVAQSSGQSTPSTSWATSLPSVSNGTCSGNPAAGYGTDYIVEIPPGKAVTCGWAQMVYHDFVSNQTGGVLSNHAMDDPYDHNRTYTVSCSPSDGVIRCTWLGPDGQLRPAVQYILWRG